MRKPPPLFGDDVDRDWASRIGHLSNADRVHRFRANAREIGELPRVRHRRVRESCRLDLLRFGLVYCTGSYAGMKPLLKRPPSKRMLRFIDALQDITLHGGLRHVRWPRGKGKSTWVKIAIIWASVYNHSFFSVVVEKTRGMAKVVVEEVWKRIYLSPKIAADFPEFAIPMKDVEMSPQRMRSQTYLGHPTRMKMDVSSFNYFKLPTMAGLYNTGAIIAFRGADQALRGINIESARPKLFFIDDPQDEFDARNQNTVANIEANITGAVLGSGEIDETISAVMASTPIEPDDVSETFANPETHPEWRTVTEPLVVSFGPEDLMNDFLRRAAIDEQDAHDFFVANRAAIEQGVEMMDDGDFDASREVSAYEHALNLLVRQKSRFYSEYQMKPKGHDAALDLRRDKVATCNLPVSHRLTVPVGFTFTCAATDINPSYALTTSVVAFKPDRTAFVVDHFTSPIEIDSRLDDTNFNLLVYNALALHGAAIAKLNLPIAAWGIDGSGRQFTSVTAFAKVAPNLKDVRLPTCAMLGRAQTKFNPNVKSRIRDAINSTVLCADEIERAALAKGQEHVGNRWIFWDSDRYKEAVQRAFLAQPGAPGGCSLFADGRHDEFAIQLTNERLLAKRPHGGDAEEYVWKSADPHDFLDTMGMCYAIAGHNGISGNPITRRFKRVKPKVIIL